MRLDEVHGVVNRHPGSNRTTRGVDIEEDVFIWVFAFQKQQLRDNQIGRFVCYRADQENDALFQKA